MGECNDSMFNVSNVKFMIHNSEEEQSEPEPLPPGDLVVTADPSPFLNWCDEGCAECRVAYYTNYPLETFGSCVNDIEYRYGNQCKTSHDQSRCSTDPAEMAYCFKAYPAASDLKWKDPDNKCRTVREFNRQSGDDFDWTWGSRNQSTSKGLCKLSTDPDRVCAWSWDASEARTNKGWTSMVRQRPTVTV